MSVRGVLVACAALAAAAGCSRAPVERVEWTVMDTVAAFQWRAGRVAEPVRAADAVQTSFAEVERLLNAFDPASELSRLAALTNDAEVLARCDARVRPCYAAAFRLRDETHGAFDPRWRGPGTLDLGAIAKGFAVDLAVAALRAEGSPADALVDLGGNLRAADGAWHVGVYGAEDTLELAPDAACATSGTYFRGDHIRDARNGSSVQRAERSVTVVHPASAMLADGLSTVLFILGREAGGAFLREHYPEARAIWTGDAK